MAAEVCGWEALPPVNKLQSISQSFSSSSTNTPTGTELTTGSEEDDEKGSNRFPQTKGSLIKQTQINQIREGNVTACLPNKQYQKTIE